MGPTENDQQAAAAGTPADTPPAVMPGQVVSPGGATSQSADGVLTISHNDTPSPASPADATGSPAPNPNGAAPADEKPAMIEYRADGEPVAVSTPGVPYTPPPPPDPIVDDGSGPVAPPADAVAPADPNAGPPASSTPPTPPAPGAVPQQ